MAGKEDGNFISRFFWEKSQKNALERMLHGKIDSPRNPYDAYVVMLNNAEGPYEDEQDNLAYALKRMGESQSVVVLAYLKSIYKRVPETIKGEDEIISHEGLDPWDMNLGWNETINHDTSTGWALYPFAPKALALNLKFNSNKVSDTVVTNTHPVHLAMREAIGQLQAGIGQEKLHAAIVQLGWDLTGKV